jgi:hypothetical protein
LQTTQAHSELTPPATPADTGAFPRDALLVLAAAMLGRLPILGAFWNRDDWTLLARASGLVDGDAFPARYVSQDLYWTLLYPLFGLATDPWAWTRLGLHAAAAWLLTRIARRVGLSAPAALLAGLLFAAAPLAFTPLYWAAGVQDLLGAMLALLAIDRLLAGGRGALVSAVVAGVLAIFAKENALGLGLFVGAVALLGDRTVRRARLIAACVLILAAGVEIALLWRHFPHGVGSGYGLDPLNALPLNLVHFGWWLITPAPFFATDGNLLVSLGGLLVWTLWLAWSWRRWPAGDRLPAAGLAAALLSLAPALVMDMPPRPYLAYLAFAPVVLVLAGALWGNRRRVPPILAIGLTLVSAAAGWAFVEARLSARGADELPSDRLVLHTAVSHEALSTIDAITTDTVVILQLPNMSLSTRPSLGTPDHTPLPSVLHTALAGDLGYRLHGDAGRNVTFVRRLDKSPLDALVFADAGPRLLFWGPVPQAFIYQTLTQIAYGRFDDAVTNLWHGLRNSPESMPFVFDESQLPVTLDAIRARKSAFLHRIETMAGLHPDEREAMTATAQEIFLRCQVTP